MQNQISSPMSDPECLDVMARLARPKAYLQPGADGGIVLSTPATASRQPVGPSALAALRAAGFLEQAAGAVSSGNLILSAAGRAALRQTLMASSGQTSRRRGNAKATEKRMEAGALTPMRTNRTGVVEQLAGRLDQHGQRLLEPVHVAAAQRFACDFLTSGLQPRVTARWAVDAIPERRRRGAPGAGVEVTETVAAAQSRVRAALDALGGMLADIVLDVCAFEHGLEAVEARRCWPRGSARVLLRGALEQLAHHYRMIAPARAQTVSLRQWGDGAHRPTGSTWVGG